MKFKKPYMQEQLHQRGAFLQYLAQEFERISTGFGIESIVTRVTDLVEGSSGVHEAGRGIDFRDEFPKGEFRYSINQRNELLHYFNETYKRKDGKKTIIHHSFRGTSPYHFHLQVPYSMGVYIDVHKSKNEIEESQKEVIIMSEDNKGVTMSVEMTDAVLTAGVSVDIMQVLRNLAAKSDNTIDDALVEMLALAAKNADWKGYAKSVL